MYVTHRSFAAPAPAIRDFFWLYHAYSLLRKGFYDVSLGFGPEAKTLRGQLAEKTNFSTGYSKCKCILAKISHFECPLKRQRFPYSCCFIDVLVSIKTRLHSPSIHAIQAQTRLVLAIFQAKQSSAKKWPLKKIFPRVPPLYFGQ